MVNVLFESKFSCLLSSLLISLGRGRGCGNGELCTALSSFVDPKTNDADVCPCGPGICRLLSFFAPYRVVPKGCRDGNRSRSVLGGNSNVNCALSTPAIGPFVCTYSAGTPLLGGEVNCPPN